MQNGCKPLPCSSKLNSLNINPTVFRFGIGGVSICKLFFFKINVQTGIEIINVQRKNCTFYFGFSLIIIYSCAIFLLTNISFGRN